MYYTTKGKYSATKQTGGEGNASASASSIAELSRSPSLAPFSNTTTAITTEPATTTTQTSSSTTDTAHSNRSVNYLSSSSYKDNIGYLHVIGEVQDTSPDAQKFIKVTATFYDSAKRIVDTSFAFTDVDVLTRGNVSV